MEIISENKYKIIVFILIIIITYSGYNYYNYIYKPDKIATRAYEIIHEEDLSQLEYLKEVLKIDSDYYLLVFAQQDIITLFHKYEIRETTDDIINYYKRINDPLGKMQIIGALGFIGGMDSVVFLENELHTTNNVNKKLIYISLFKIYFSNRAEDDVKNKIYNIYNKSSLSDEEILLRKYLIMYIEGNKQYIEKIKKIVKGNNEILKETLVDMLAYYIENKELIKQHKHLNKIINELSKNEEYQSKLKDYK